jgi:hypothetical protein
MIRQTQYYCALLLWSFGLGIMVTGYPVYALYNRGLLVPDDVRVILDTHVQEVTPLIEACERDPHCKTKQRVGYFSWLPDYFIKYDVVRRMEGAAQLDACIKKHKLHLLSVPQKYLYRVKGRGKQLNNHNYLVVSPRVVGGQPKPLSLSQVKQLVVIIQEIQFWDFWKDNLFFTEGDTLTFIDTGFDTQRRTYGSKLSHELEAISRLVRYFILEDDAFAYLIETLKNLKKRHPRRFHKEINTHLDKLSRIRD